jgi:hypothetical protein
VNAVESLFASPRDIPNLARANCRGQAEIWDAEDPADWRVRKAMAGCRPVRGRGITAARRTPGEPGSRAQLCRVERIELQAAVKTG